MSNSVSSSVRASSVVLGLMEQFQQKYVQVARIDKTSSSYFSNKQSRNFYVVSAQSIFKKDFFFTVLLSNRPYLKRWPKHLPFNFEKSFDENKILPFNAGVLKKELFVSIDDNHGEQGYSLISRKKYPKRVSKKQLDEIRKIKIRIFAQNPLKKTIEKFFTLFK